jgi:RHS repeat-associated protein
MTCRAPTSSQTCSGTPTGQALTYDALGRLLTWSDGSGNSAVYGYDGSGNRVEQVATSGSTTTTTVYVGGDEEVSTSGSTTTTTTYYAAGPVTAINVNGTLSYLVSDTLGSTTVALSASGSVQADQLFTPYGATRYASGTMPTSYGFTGQRLDPSGLSYFNARYYDGVVGQFVSADSVQGPNRYAYVDGNPETLTDPTGKFGRCGGGALADGVCWASYDRPHGSSGGGSNSGSGSSGGSSGGGTGGHGGSGGGGSSGSGGSNGCKPPRCAIDKTQPPPESTAPMPDAWVFDLLEREGAPKSIISDFIGALEFVGGALASQGVYPDGCDVLGCPAPTGQACLHAAPCNNPTTGVTRWSKALLTNEGLDLGVDRDIIGLFGFGASLLAAGGVGTALVAAFLATVGLQPELAIPIVQALDIFVTVYGSVLASMALYAYGITGVMTTLMVDPVQNEVATMSANSNVYSSGLLIIPTFYTSSEVSCPPIPYTCVVSS